MNTHPHLLNLTGTGVALVTPFTATGEVDYNAIGNLLNHVCSPGGAEYLVVLGSTGESVVLSPDERRQVFEFVKANKPQGMPLVLGFGGNDTAAMLNATPDKDWDGVDAVLSVSPYYNRPSQRGIIAHFTALADALPVPVILYNVPSRTGSNLEANTTLTLAQHPNIIAIKEASGNMEQCQHILARKPANFQFLSGDDFIALPLIASGANGVISVLGNLIPQSFCSMIRLAIAGNFELARPLLYSIANLNTLMYTEGNPAGVKAGLSLEGICTDVVRLPLVSASDELKAAIKQAMVNLC